ncbi:zinc-binding dehydrogenase, partial [Catenuloplanes japonicus]|uniref:zinc-binding dehydrogenase n=1 Tax=Catenuloplanes japonicus TaxID=33876 RepID=UPI0012FC9ACF
MAVRPAAEGRLRIPVAATFPLERAAEAHALSESRHARGKIVFAHRESPAGFSRPPRNRPENRKVSGQATAPGGAGWGVGWGQVVAGL